jgi:hypothetical protein
MKKFASDMARCLPSAALLALLAAVPAAPAQQSNAPATNPAGARKPARVEEEKAPGSMAEQALKALAAKGKDEEKTSLEDLLAEALKNNPDIRVADAKVQEAEAELNRTRLAVMHKVVTFYASRKAAQAKVAEAERRLARLRQLRANSAISQEDFQLAEQALLTAKAELELVEAEMPSLLGKPPQKMAGQATEQGQVPVLSEVPYLNRLYRLHRDREVAGLYEPARGQTQLGQPAPGTVAEKVRKALNAPITVDFQETPLNDVLDYLGEKTGITIRSQVTRSKDANPKITLRFREPLPLRAVLQALEDEFPSFRTDAGVRFVVREYGLLAVPNGFIPPGAVFVDRLGVAEAADGARKRAEATEGTIKSIDPGGQIVTITVGSDAGITKAQVLHVYRLMPVPIYLGTLKVLEVYPDRAVAAIGSMNARGQPFQVGDRVASKLLGQ